MLIYRSDPHKWDNFKAASMWREAFYLLVPYPDSNDFISDFRTDKYSATLYWEAALKSPIVEHTLIRAREGSYLRILCMRKQIFMHSLLVPVHCKKSMGAGEGSVQWKIKLRNKYSGTHSFPGPTPLPSRIFTAKQWKVSMFQRHAIESSFVHNDHQTD